MSSDYSVVCETCKIVRHLGQRMGGTYSFGFGSKDADEPPKIMEWIDEHASENHELRILGDDSIPESYIGCYTFLWLEDCYPPVMPAKDLLYKDY